MFNCFDFSSQFQGIGEDLGRDRVIFERTTIPLDGVRCGLFGGGQLHGLDSGSKPRAALQGRGES